VYKEAYFNINNLDSAIPSMVVSLLQEFDDVFLEDIPNGLPPLRGIEHQIDLVPIICSKWSLMKVLTKSDLKVQ
jgi:hypothetical protein